MFYDKNNKKITSKQWSILLEDDKYRTVKQESTEKYWISTVWLGLNHNFSFQKNKRPIIFEIGVFKQYKNGKIKEGSVELRRYATLREARKGHRELIKKYS